MPPRPARGRDQDIADDSKHSALSVVVLFIRIFLYNKIIFYTYKFNNEINDSLFFTFLFRFDTLTVPTTTAATL